MANPNFDEMWRTEREITEPKKYGEEFARAMLKAQYGSLSYVSKEDVTNTLKVVGGLVAINLALGGGAYVHDKLPDETQNTIDQAYHELIDANPHIGVGIQMLPAYMLAEMMLKDTIKKSAVNVQHNKAAPPDTSASEAIGTEGKAGNIAKAIPPIIAASAASGCMDDVEDVKKYVKDPIGERSIYVYEDELGEKGDPKKVISEGGLYAMVEAESGGDEKSGIPQLRAVREYVIQTDLETEDIIIHDAQGNPVDQSDIPDNWKELIVKDKYGMPIADVDQLDLRINPIGKNKYEILNLAQEMEDSDGGIWKKVFEKIDPYVDEKLVDNIIGDKDAEITGGLVLGENGDVLGVVIANERQFEIYGGDFGLCVGGENTRTVPKYYGYDTEKGIYIYIYDLSQLPEWNRDDGDRIIEKCLSIKGLDSFSGEIDIAKKEGKYPYFRFEKTAS